jgi:outer membrane lipoprotein carrier protein
MRLLRRTLTAAALLVLAAPAYPAPSRAVYALPLYPAATAEITVPLVLERFERFDAGLHTLSGEFRQSVHSQDTGQSQSVSGTLAYSKKDRLRIEHIAPEPQTLVCDGARVWVWRPANGQVIRSKLADWKKSQPLAQGLLDFGNYAGLLKRYDVSLATVSAPGADGHRSLALALRPLGTGRGDFLLTLRLSTKDFFPFDSELRVGAVTARTSFSAIRFNPKLPDAQFQFRPPPGADVLDFPAAER